MGATRQWIAAAILASLGLAAWAQPAGQEGSLKLRPTPSLGAPSGVAVHKGSAPEDASTDKPKTESGAAEDSKAGEAAQPPLDIDPPEATLEGLSFAQSASGKRLGAIAWATIKTDPLADWPSGKVPKIPQARVVRLGERVSLLVFVATRADIALDAPEGIQYAVDIYKPDGSFDKRFDSTPCLPKAAAMEAGTLAVCEGSVTFEVEEDDPRGLWVFKITMPQPDGKPLVFGTSFEAY